jgi:tetratricopeptide (TPR) repeat protein
VLVGGAALYAGRMAAKAEGQSYFDSGAYALADARLREGGAPSAQLGKVHLAWANSDLSAGAYDDAAKHYRLALRLLPKGSDHDQASDSLKSSVADWGAGLRAAQQFPEAIKVYRDNEKAGQCDTACATALDTARGLTYLAWARHLIVTGQSADAITQLTAMTRDVPAGPEVTNAKLVLDNATSPLAGLKSADTPETLSARDLLVLLVATQHANDEQGQAAAAYPIQVTGSIESTYVQASPEHMLFLAFASDADAQAFIQHLRNNDVLPSDPSLFRIIGHADAKNAFTAWLPAGFSYVPIWETVGPKGDLGYFYFSTTAYAIPAFSLPIALGSITSR